MKLEREDNDEYWGLGMSQEQHNLDKTSSAIRAVCEGGGMIPSQVWLGTTDHGEMALLFVLNSGNLLCAALS